MDTHTPGPWHFRMSDNATPHIMHERGADWTDIDDHSSLVCHMPAEIARSYNSFANARLIAAAPEMFEFACWIIDSDPEGETSQGPLFVKARAVRAKATGA